VKNQNTACDRAQIRNKHLPNTNQERYDCAKQLDGFIAIFSFSFYQMITHQTLIQEEIRRRMYSGNACYHSVQNLLSSRLLSKKFKNSVRV
jgi:hypothetical protein